MRLSLRQVQLSPSLPAKDNGLTVREGGAATTQANAGLKQQKKSQAFSHCGLPGSKNYGYEIYPPRYRKLRPRCASGKSKFVVPKH
jgi:hypothetical protein